MISNWIIYASALFAALTMRVFYTGSLAGLTLAAMACLPLLGAAVTLPAALTCRLSLVPAEPWVARGGTAQWQVTGRSPLGLPLGQIRLTVESVNQMTGEVFREKAVWVLPGSGASVTLPAPTDHCGLLAGRVVSAWCADSLGLFWLPLRRGEGSQLWVAPVPRTAQLPPLPEEARPGVRPRPGGGPGEDYDPREYRPGDPLNTIHWKLSAKRGELVTRETLETIRTPVLLTLDCFGAPDAMDTLLDTLAGLSSALMAQGRPHAVAWAHPETGELIRFPVEGEADWKHCLEALLAQAVPAEGKSVLDAPQLGPSLHLTPGGEAT